VGVSIKPRVVRAHFWSRIRVQLGGALLLGTVLPFSVGAAITPGLIGLDLFLTSFLAANIAIVGGFWLFRNLIEFPGIRASYYVLPVFLSTFATAFATLFLLRLDYSRSLLVTGFLVAVVWHYAVYFMIQRRYRFSIAVVPKGRVEMLYAIDSVIWVPLATPHLPRGCSTLTADFDHDLEPEWEAFLAECALLGVSVLHYKQLRQSLTGQVEMEHLSENAFGSLVPNKTYLMIKCAIDIVVAGVALLLLLPVLAILAIAIRLDSPGPIFFRQRRVGYRGEIFTVWKFRTMYQQVADRAGGEMSELLRISAMTKDRDPRVTRLGRHLRQSRLDELPQIINVLRGEMSWIGPRPEADILSRWYQSEIPFYRYRHIVRPGISGWAQVNQGHVADLDDVLRKLSYDFFYISRFTLWLDVLVVIRTIKTMVTGFGAR